ncbi:MAG TPA: GNAT family N-acetyltransferase [Pyrinomonadaceae bacterium]|jgi:N-acetylglutamate synthase-like GNAT family acetyltransferase|nr:GNAT family N-acetyltransferase [Pyrinomonadaceae bacterium]
MTEVSVRFAAPADLSLLQPRSHLPAEMVKRKVEWREVIVAERRGGFVGALHLEYLWSSVPYVALIYVLPEHQRRGVGGALLRFAEAFLREQGHDTLYSSSQADEREPQAWHRHAGFEECGIIAGINKGVGEVFFRKRLS